MMEPAEKQIDDMFEMIAGAMYRNADVIAEAHWEVFQALLDQGFTSEHAIQILTSSNMMEVE